MNTSRELEPLPYQDESESTLTAIRGVVRFLKLLQRRKQTVSVFVVVAFTLGTVYYALAPRQYQSTAKLMIRRQAPDQISTVGDPSSADTIMDSQRELVRSAKVVQAAIETLPPQFRVDLADTSPREWVSKITERLSASTIRKTEHMQVSYRSCDPEAAAAVVAAVIESYIRFVEVSHRTGAADVLEALTGERDRLNQERALKQRHLQDFRTRIGHLAMRPDSNVVEPTIHRAVQLNDAVVEAQKRRLDLQASLGAVQNAMSKGEDLRRHLGVVEEVVGERMLLSSLGLGDQDTEILVEQQQRLLDAQTELRRVSHHLGDSHPDVISLREQISATQQYLSNYHASAGRRFASIDNRELGPLLQTMLAQSVSQALRREQELQHSFELARAEAVRQSGELAQLHMLEREVDRIEKQHDLLFEKIAAVDIHQVQAPIRVVAVEDPLPSDAPVSPQLPTTLLGAAFVGLILGALYVYGQDLLDDRFVSPDEMASQLNLPVLTLVRSLEPTGGNGLNAVQMLNGNDNADLEAFRTLRTSLSLADQASDRLVVSSAEPGDGKTTVSSNLAVALAQVGKRTLVIDADLRRPGLTALLDMKGKRGLSDILTCHESVADLAAEVVQSTELATLDVISAGPRRPNPAEMLSSKNFEDLLAWADARYDQVLIDCPPVLAVSDAQIVGRLVDGVILVVTPEKNHRRLVTRACDSFLSLGIHMFGVVGNRISEHAGEGYGYGYGYSYGSEESDDEPTAREDEQRQSVALIDWQREGETNPDHLPYEAQDRAA